MPNFPARRKWKQLNNIPWSDGKTYDFRYTECLRSFYCDSDTEDVFASQPTHSDASAPIDEARQQHFKEVYYGFFLDEAPEGLTPYVFYYLKRIHALHTEAILNETRISRYPQTRERHELLELEGPHLRKPLAVNDQARLAARELNDRFDCSERSNCCVVERPYRVLDSTKISFQKELTIFERLEYLDQVCDALLELYRNQVAGRAICAYRDLKIGNCLIEPGRPGRLRFTVKLTDYATIRFQDDMEPTLQPTESASLQPSSGDLSFGTAPGVMSPENTSPEGLLDPQNVSSKIDVYALSQMLALMFGYIHFADTGEFRVIAPNHQFYYDCSRSLPMNTYEGIELMARAFAARRSTDNALEWFPGQQSWLERAIQTNDRQTGAPIRSFQWGNPYPSGEQPGEELLMCIRELFFHGTRIDPAKRPTVEEFQAELRRLKAMVNETRSSSPVLYNIPQSLYLIHMDCTSTDQEALIQAARKAKEADGAPAQIFWYLNSAKAVITAAPGPLCTDAGMLTTEMAKRKDDDLFHGLSFTEAMSKAYDHYSSTPYENAFNGDIHIFSLQHVPLRQADPITGLPLDEILDGMYSLSRFTTNQLRIFIHSPKGAAASDFMLTNYDFRIKPFSLSRQTAQQHKPIQEAPQPAPVQNRYPTDANGLFFMRDGRQVFVGQRKSR